MKELKEIILKMINEIEKKETNLRVNSTGGGHGKVYPDKTVGVLKMLGNEEGEYQEDYVLNPVTISKAFLKRKINE